ncbi:hypothetical protein M0813_25205 [Anaeramoeba flamelloides]|uniref:Uncharacterized protein n=1 Tax=Anaeramoeba flamelloides TaxID=1746091 RepID=A0ABQ8Y3C1_9EUKA|nr:hypothetical protein M0813_25205 [Anaeramoeba flamelloides]
MLDNLDVFKQTERGINEMNTTGKIASDLGIARICWKGFTRLQLFDQTLDLFSLLLNVYSNFDNNKKINNFCFSSIMIIYLIKYLSAKDPNEEMIPELKLFAQSCNKVYTAVVEKFIQIFTLSDENAILVAFWKLFHTCFIGIAQFSFILDSLLSLLVHFDNKNNTIILATLKLIPHFLASYQMQISIQDFHLIKVICQYFSSHELVQFSFYANQILSVLILHPPQLEQEDYLTFASKKNSLKNLKKLIKKVFNSRIGIFYINEKDSSKYSQINYQNALKKLINYLIQN